MRTFSVSILLLVLIARASADGPRDNLPENVRRIPKLGIEVPAAERTRLEQGLSRLQQKLQNLRKKKDAQELLPDVEIFYRAVHDALEYQEFFAERDIKDGLELLEVGLKRAEQLEAGKPEWTQRKGLVVRGYRSRIDHSVQPYGLVVPQSYHIDGRRQHRLDLWFHGRGETLSEVKFLAQRMRSPGQFTPEDAFVLHPYGRYSNAFKFAGEVDVLEALADVRGRYRIDDSRTSARGFSMGGAACWQFAVHYADRWFAANPGAGFSETPEFLKFFQKETLHPTWYEEKLWRLYDCNRYALNLYHCPTVAYSGELDIQKQAADVMEAALAKHGIDLVHVIGPQTKHRYHPEAKQTVAAKLDSLAERGKERFPKRIHLQTYTLKYNRMHWLTIDALAEHWEEARVDAVAVGDSDLRVATQNVTALSFDFPPGYSPFDITRKVTVAVDEQVLEVPGPRSDRSWHAALMRDNGKWVVGTLPADELRKRHDLQGPIDDAFMDSFIFVRPTQDSPHQKLQQWSASELERAIEHWRRHFRGNARVKKDTEITQEDIASANLVLWGDPASNQLLARIAEKLPVGWSRERIKVGDREFAAAEHGLILVYPNPLNPQRYVVLNSSFTFREYAYLNNARQVPMLPDWAVVDLRTPPGTQYPGKIAAAGFFNEQWELKPPPE